MRREFPAEAARRGGGRRGAPATRAADAGRRDLRRPAHLHHRPRHARATSTTPSRCAPRAPATAPGCTSPTCRYFVAPDGAIDAEARRRTASLYLPLWAEPMLPAELILGRVQPGRGRAAQDRHGGVHASTPTGRRTSVAFYRSPIVSDHRLTYGFVDGVLAGGCRRASRRRHATDASRAERREAAPPVAGGRGGAAAAKRGRRRATRAGTEAPARRRTAPAAGRRAGRQAARRALRARRPADRLVRARVPLRRARRARGRRAERLESPSHSLVEEFMLAANEAVAAVPAGRHARAVYRVHEPPEPAATAGAARRHGGARRAHAAVSRRPAATAARRRRRPAAALRDAAQGERPRAPRPPRLSAAPAALAQAGALRPREPGPLRPGQRRLPALHLADPPLRRPRRAPRPAVPAWATSGARARATASSPTSRRAARRWSARSPSSSSPPTTSPSPSCSSAGCTTRAGRASSRARSSA